MSAVTMNPAKEHRWTKSSSSSRLRIPQLDVLSSLSCLFESPRRPTEGHGIIIPGQECVSR